MVFLCVSVVSASSDIWWDVLDTTMDIIFSDEEQEIVDFCGEEGGRFIVVRDDDNVHAFCALPEGFMCDATHFYDSRGRECLLY